MPTPVPAAAPSADASAPPGAVEAVVQAGATETRYHRAGCGAPLLLLVPGGAAGALGGPLFALLSARFRVVAPVPPEDEAEVERWLGEVLDGLGLSRPALVAAGALAAPARAFARADPERVGRVVVCSPDEPGESAVDDDAGCLVVRAPVDDAPGSVAARVEKALRGLAEGGNG